MNDEDHLLAALEDQPGWPILVRLADEVQVRRRNAIANSLLAGQDPDIRAIDFERGERAGADWLLRQPSVARTRIEKDRVKAGA